MPNSSRIVANAISAAVPLRTLRSNAPIVRARSPTRLALPLSDCEINRFMALVIARAPMYLIKNATKIMVVIRSGAPLNQSEKEFMKSFII